jgi:LysM repeat protein
VRSGESLTSIATKYRVDVADLQRWNGIRNASHVEAGQKLIVYTPAAVWTRHTVKAGESLGSIATKYGCTVAELRSWNGLSGSVIHPGDALKIKKD